MNKSLFQIEQEYQLLTDQLIESEGELTPELEQALDIAQTELQTKGVAYSYIIKKIDAECDIIDAEIKRLQSIKKARENASERLKTRIKQAMELFDMPKIETPLIKLSFRKSESVEVDDINSLPAMYKTIKLTETPDKKLIKDSLKLGKEIPGCRIVENNNLQIK
jgi:hypothetical protein